MFHRLASAYAEWLVSPFPDQRLKSKVEGLERASTRVITLKREKKSNLQHRSGAASPNVDVKECLIIKRGSGFFKKNEAYTPACLIWEKHLRLYEPVKRRYPRSAQEADEAVHLTRWSRKD